MPSIGVYTKLYQIQIRTNLQHKPQWEKWRQVQNLSRILLKLFSKAKQKDLYLLFTKHTSIFNLDFTLLEAFFKDGFRITIFNVTHTYLHCPLEYWLPLSIRTVYTYGISFFITKKVTMAKSWQNAFSHSFFLLICLTFLVYKLYFICWNKFTEFPIGFYP